MPKLERMRVGAGLGLFSSKETTKRGFRLLEFASLIDLKLAITFGPHKGSRKMDLVHPKWRTSQAN